MLSPVEYMEHYPTSGSTESPHWLWPGSPASRGSLLGEVWPPRCCCRVSRKGALGAATCVHPKQWSEQVPPHKVGHGSGDQGHLLTTGPTPPQLSIDSCWVGSFYCPQASFTATIYDAIATESTLFIRQNQLIYYFTGTYTTLYESKRGSGEGSLAGSHTLASWPS